MKVMLLFLIHCNEKQLINCNTLNLTQSSQLFKSFLMAADGNVVAGRRLTLRVCILRCNSNNHLQKRTELNKCIHFKLSINVMYLTLHHSILNSN